MFCTYFYISISQTLDTPLNCYTLIGYKGTTIDNYNGSGTGSETQVVLTQWFIKISHSDPWYQPLRTKLEAYGQSLEKNISRRTWTQGGIYLPRT